MGLLLNEPNMTTLSPTTLILLAGLFGLLFGSFISMLSWRLPRLMECSFSEQLKQISISRSACPACHKPLNWIQLFPVFSWLASKGKCKHCQAKISARYPLIEITTALLTSLIVWQFGLTTEGILAIIFTYILITLSIIDIEHHLILDNLTLPLLWLGLIANSQLIFTTPENAIYGAVLGYLILWIVFQSFKALTGKEGMGYGDFKLLAALGAWFGVEAIPQIILIASLASIVWTILWALLKGKSLRVEIPFGPYLALGGMVSLIAGQVI